MRRAIWGWMAGTCSLWAGHAAAQSCDTAKSDQTIADCTGAQATVPDALKNCKIPVKRQCAKANNAPCNPELFVVGTAKYYREAAAKEACDPQPGQGGNGQSRGDQNPNPGTNNGGANNNNANDNNANGGNDPESGKGDGTKTPLVLSLGKPVAFAKKPVAFDFVGDGKATPMGWIGPNNAFLVRDANANGLVDDGSEMFGSATPLRDGGKAPDGFAALAQWDDDGDGQITPRDAVWPTLMVWRDANGDGISSEDELQSLAAAGIESLSLSYAKANEPDPKSNVVGLVGSYQVRTPAGDLVTHALVDVYFGRTFADGKE